MDLLLTEEQKQFRQSVRSFGVIGKPSTNRTTNERIGAAHSSIREKFVDGSSMQPQQANQWTYC